MKGKWTKHGYLIELKKAKNNTLKKYSYSTICKDPTKRKEAK